MVIADPSRVGKIQINLMSTVVCVRSYMLNNNTNYDPQFTPLKSRRSGSNFSNSILRTSLSCCIDRQLRSAIIPTGARRIRCQLSSHKLHSCDTHRTTRLSLEASSIEAKVGVYPHQIRPELCGERTRDWGAVWESRIEGVI